MTTDAKRQATTQQTYVGICVLGLLIIAVLVNFVIPDKALIKMDVLFNTKHRLDENEYLQKRRTPMGGATFLPREFALSLP